MKNLSKTMSSLVILIALGGLSSCASLPLAQPNPQIQFLNNLKKHCGQAFKGRLVSTDAVDADFANKDLIMHVSTCEINEVKVPFNVGKDRSRTWVISKTDKGLRLKHDHRHQDGTEDELTQYGGDTAAKGTAQRQDFPVDDFSITLFNRTNKQVSVTNIWAVEIIPGKIFAYELRRANRHFRIEFDLTKPVSTPPPSWGHE
jgi:hypothetical protein